MPLLMAEVALNLGDVFYVFFDDIGICTYCKKVVTTTSLATLMLKTSLALVLLASLALMGELPTRYVRIGKISRFSPFGVFFLFFCRLIPLGILSVNLTGIAGWL